MSETQQKACLPQSFKIGITKKGCIKKPVNIAEWSALVGRVATNANTNTNMKEIQIQIQ